MLEILYQHQNQHQHQYQDDKNNLSEYMFWKLTDSQIKSVTDYISLRSLISILSEQGFYATLPKMDQSQLSLLINEYHYYIVSQKPEFIKYISPSQLNLLTKIQIDSITPLISGTISSPPKDQEISNLSKGQMLTLSREQIQSLTNNQLSNNIMYINPVDLTSQQLNYVRPIINTKLSTDLPTYTKEDMTFRNIASYLTSDQIKSLTLDQISGLTSTTIRSFTPTQIQAFTQTQLQALKPETFYKTMAGSTSTYSIYDSLTETQKSYLSQEQKNASGTYRNMQ